MTLEQDWQADRYARNARFVADLAEDLIDLLAPVPGERILDIGCGDGALTAKIVAAGAEVVAVDAGPDMVAAARAAGLDARVMDGQALTFDHEFDAVFTNAAMHWMPNQDAVIAGVARALMPGGRFVGEFGGGSNVASILEGYAHVLGKRGLDSGSANPWCFPSLEEHRGRLIDHGFTVDHIDLFQRPTEIPGALGDWLETLGGTFLGLVDEAERATVKTEMEDYLCPRLVDANGKWILDYERLRFRAYL